MHRYIVKVTFTLLIMALLVSVGWLIKSPDFEPAITFLSLAAAIMGLFIDRWLRERENRRQLLRALKHEIYMNLNVLESIKKITRARSETGPHILPRFYNSTVSNVIASGLFSSGNDAQLWKLLHGWVQHSTDANNRFLQTEIYTLSHPQTAVTFYNKMSTGKVIAGTYKVLINLSDHLLEAYAKESGIDRDTVLFADSEDNDLA